MEGGKYLEMSVSINIASQIEGAQSKCHVGTHL